VSKMRNVVICYFIFNNPSSIRGQKVNIYFVVLCEDFFVVTKF